MRFRIALIFGVLISAGAVYYYYIYDPEPEANGMSYAPAVSADGSRVAFHSEADNLVADDDNKVTDVFIRDLDSEETFLVSMNADGDPGNGGSYNASVDAAGTKVVFISDASNLVADDDNTCEEEGERLNCPDVFLRDLDSGEIRRVSTSSAGEQANWKSESASISADGRYVVFSSFASNLVEDDTNFCKEQQTVRNCSDIFLKDMETGAVRMVSASDDGSPGDGDSFGPSISADGRFVAFHSRAKNLIADDENGAPDVFLKDMEDGSIIRISEIAKDIGGNTDSYNAVVSGDGTKVVFISAADNLVPGDTNDSEDIFVNDLELGLVQLVSFSASGVGGNSYSSRPAISADGRFVGFDTMASSLFGGDTAKCGEGEDPPSCSDVLLKSLLTEVVHLVSSDKDGAQGNWHSYSPSVSADGSFVAFASEASNLVRGDSDACSDASGSFNCSDIFIKEIESGEIRLVSRALDD